MRVGSGVNSNATANYVISRPQLEVSDFGATDYIATTTAAVSVGPVSVLPRLDYLNSSCPRLLLEPQRTNLALFSEQIGNASFWALSNSGTITSNNQISPDGYQNADTLNAGAASSQVQGAQTGTSGAVYTVSVYLKRITGTGNVFLRAVENVDTAITITSEWQRYSLSVTSTSTTIRIGIKLATSGDAVAIWGGQIEQASYATSYIPTLGTSVTRVADAASKTGISSLIGQTEGTLFAEFDFVSGETANYALLHQAAFSTYIFINQGVSGTIFGQIQPFGVSFSAAKPNGRYKCALAYKSGDSAFFVNGVQVGTTNTTTFTPATMDIFNFTADPHTNSNYQALLFKTRLTNAQLAELTA